MNKIDQLRNLPSVDELLRCDEIAELRRQHSHRRVADWVRSAVQDCREAIIDGVVLDSESTLRMIVDRVRVQLDNDMGRSIRRVINATGVVLHTNLGRAPLADRAVKQMNEAARYTNVELNLDAGRRSKRGERVSELLAQLAGSEDALVVNNCAAATMLVLQTIASGREVIVSRGQLVEIGGGFRLPDVFRSAGVSLREVGTTNRTYLGDYETAIGESTGAIIRVHHSNFQLTGFVTEPTIDELVMVRRPQGIAVIDDLGSGCIEDLSSLGLTEPTVPASVRAGADLTLFSGDKLFGGPQCGIIVGRSQWIDPLRKSPLMRAFRIDKLTLAALEATTEIHLAGDAFAEIPTLRMLAADASDIERRCSDLRRCVVDLCDAQVAPCQSQVGGGSVPGSTLESYGLKITAGHADRLAKLLRAGWPAVQARVTDDCVLLDLRTVAAGELEPLSARLRDALQQFRDEDLGA